MKKALWLTLIAAAFGGSLAWLSLVGASGTPGNDSWERYRAPWPERVKYERDGGCPVGSDGSPPCQYHATAVPAYRWAIDLNDESDETEGPNSDCGDPLKATRLGGSEFYKPGQVGGSSYLGVEHYNAPGDLDETWYVHVSYNDDAVSCEGQTCYPWDSVYAQGDFVARMSNVDRPIETPSPMDCHLHFFVTDGTYSWNPSLNLWMSGVWPWTGYDLQHLSDDNMTGHASNNTGPGYGRPYTGACPPWVPGGLWADRGPDNRPLVWPIRTYARDMAAFAQDAGSTRAAIQGPCGANRRWVKGCYFGSGVYAYSQSFVTDYAGLQIPLSITEGYPSGTAYRIMGTMWKAYGRRIPIGPPPHPPYKWVYEVLGRPIGEEYAVGTYIGQQDFEFGHMHAYRSDIYNVLVYVYDNSWNLTSI